jgi:hypothetical protein
VLPKYFGSTPKFLPRAAVLAQALDRMRDAGGEVPEVADTDIVDEVVARGVDGGDPRLAIQHVGPFRLLVPMQLARAAGVQAHVHAGDVLGDAELADRDLAGPAALLLAHMRVGEGIAQVLERAAVGPRRVQEARILPVAQQIARAGIGAAAAGRHRLRHRRGLGIRAGGGDGKAACGHGAERGSAGEQGHMFLQSFVVPAFQEPDRTSRTLGGAAASWDPRVDRLSREAGRGRSQRPVAEASPAPSAQADWHVGLRVGTGGPGGRFRL